MAAMKKYTTPAAKLVNLASEDVMVVTASIPIGGEGTDETAPGHGTGGSLDDTRSFKSIWDYWKDE